MFHSLLVGLWASFSNVQHLFLFQDEHRMVAAVATSERGVAGEPAQLSMSLPGRVVSGAAANHPRPGAVDGCNLAPRS